MKRYLPILFTVALFVSACADGAVDETTVPTEEPADTTAPGEGPSGDPVIFGAPIALSGGFELYDGEMIEGMEFAIEEVNERGGILGRPVELIIVDHQTDVAQVEAATREVLEQGAHVIVPTVDYDFGAAAALAAADAGVVSISGAGAPDFGFEGLGEFHFNVYQGTQTEGAVMAEWAYETQQWDQAFLLVDTSIEYSTSQCEFFTEVYTGLGGEIVGEETFLSSDPSITSQVSSAAASDADVVILCSYPPGGASAVRQLRTGGVEMPIFGGAAFDGTFWLEAIPDLSGFYYPGMVSSAGDDPNPAANEFLAQTEPAGASIYALFGHLIVETIAEAAERAGTLEGQALADAIETFDGFETLVGPTTYSETCHIPVGRPMAIIEIQGGEPSFIEYVTPQLIPDAPC